VSRRTDAPIIVTVCPRGPMLIRGAAEVITGDGEHHPVRRPVAAVCRCGKSALFPWCDGTHKLLPRDKQPDASTPADVELR